MQNRLIQVALAACALLIVFLGYVSTKKGTFSYSRSGLIAAPASEIYPIISNLKRGREWSPYEKKDPNMKNTFSGADGQVGSKLIFAGNRDVGAGELEILALAPNEKVQIRLTMTEPFRAENLIEYHLTPEAGGTRFTWTMSGDGGFLGKLISTLIDCESMVAADFVTGIANVKALVEGQHKTKN